MLLLAPIVFAHDIVPADFATVASIRGPSVSPVWGRQPAGRSVVVPMARADALADPYALCGRSLDAITHVTPQADAWTMPVTQVVDWSAPDGAAVEGVLWLPAGWTPTDRFKAASSGAGVFDQTMHWALEDTPGHVINYMEGLPWERADAVRDASPLFAADQITTPTLNHVSENDPRVPAAHSRALFRALSFYPDVPTELLVYPGAGHGLSRLSHRSAKMAWDFAWLEHYVPSWTEDAQP